MDDIVHRILLTFDPPDEDGFDILELFDAALRFSENDTHYCIWYQRYRMGRSIAELSDAFGITEECVCYLISTINEQLEKYYAKALEKKEKNNDSCTSV